MVPSIATRKNKQRHGCSVFRIRIRIRIRIQTSREPEASRKESRSIDRERSRTNVRSVYARPGRPALRMLAVATL